MDERRNHAIQHLFDRFVEGEISRRDMMRGLAALGVGAAIGGKAGLRSAAAQEGSQRIRKLQLLVQPQASVPEEFETIQFAAAQLQQIGLEIDVQVMPWEQMSDLVWFNRDKWDMTAWQMVGRPERLDPDEFLFNLFHSTTAENGYNFVGYINPDYDAIAEAQRAEIDREKRKELVFQLQQMVADDQPFLFSVYPHQSYAYNKAVWDESTVVDAKGIGIKNYWTFVHAAPLGDQKDMVLNTQAVVSAINPLYISGGTDSWITEVVWDRLMRINAEGLPEPYAAESVEWLDDTNVVVTLRPGMTWHDGQPVTVDDVIFSFEAPASGEAPQYTPFVTPIASMAAIGDNQVQFTLNAPYAAFETAGLAKLNLIPKHIWEPIIADLLTQDDQNAQDYQEEVPIGSGPFKFVNWARQQEIILEANPDHFDPPMMNRWILRDMPNVSAALGALTSGEINFLSDYTGDPQLLQQTVDGSDNLAMVATIVVGFRFIAPNQRRPPLNDPALRRAMAAAIGKNPIQLNVYKGFATIADSHVSKALEFWHAPGLTEYADPNIEEARRILEEAGYSWDEDGFLLLPEGQTETLETGSA